jgi:hypothetical protein
VEVGVTHLSFDQREPSFHAAGCVIGMYYIIESDVMIDPFKLERPGWLSIIGFPTLEAAKAAAQADYAARIRSALTLTPAPDAGKVQALVDAIEVLNAACDAMWNDHERLEENPGRFGQPYRLKEVHMKAISEAQQKLPAALAAMKEG